jgi:unsaturated chondroitin disaccharide hydrolase
LASRYSPTVKAIRSWGSRADSHHFKVIVDNLMNLGLLFWAAKHGGPATWTSRAVHHARTTAAHFIRRDGSVRHLVDFDPTTGRVLSVSNPQGYRAWSTWSRGQAWAIHGFATAYAYTHLSAFLTAARRTEAYYLRHVPADCVPYWDFNAPDIPDAPRDASAAAVAADGLEELATVDPQPVRRRHDNQAADAILRSLSDDYTAPSGQAVLDGSVSTFGVDPADIGTSYGDYYYLHALEARLDRR